MNLMKEKSLLSRTLITFIEAFLSVAIVMIPTINWSDTSAMIKTTILGIIGSSISAGIEAVIAKRKETV